MSKITDPKRMDAIIDNCDDDQAVHLIHMLLKEADKLRADLSAAQADKARLDWLDSQSSYWGASLVNDDANHWTVSSDGWQNIHEDAGPFQVSFDIDDDAPWHDTVRDAIDAAMRSDLGGGR